MVVIEGSRAFQQSCVERLQEVLATHGYNEVAFEYITRGHPYYLARLDFENRAHEIEVYEDGPVMHRGEELFEPYMSEEFESEAALREGFATRLDRYLSGGPWEGPDEPGLWESVRRYVRRLAGR